MRRVRRALRILSVALITAGIVVAIDIAATLFWKEPLSTVYGSIRQGEASNSLEELEQAFPSPADLRLAEREAGEGGRVEVLADLFAERVGSDQGKGIGRIRIERIGVDTVFVEGTNTDSLRKGPGHYSSVGDPDVEVRDDGSAYPGQGRTVGIAGHRTTYLAPFKEIDEIEDGDEIVLDMPYGEFTYRVETHRIVAPSEIEIVRDMGYERLVLTACHPEFSAAERWAVFARLEDVEAPPRA
jgi:sortase A